MIRTSPGTTVAQVLADPDRFVGETLADPLEGIPYGRCKAKIMRRADGSLWIHSFAHGRTTYDLKLDFEAAQKALRAAAADAVPDLYVQLVMTADLTPTEIQRLREIAAYGADVGKRALDVILREARKAAAVDAGIERRERKLAERRDPRPFVPAPAAIAEWLPQMDTLNEVIGGSKALVPPLRDADRDCAEARAVTVPSLARLSKEGANQESDTKTRIPAPEQLLLVKMTEEQVAEMIERHIEFYIDTADGGSMSVHLPKPFVRHFMTRHDDALPIATTVAQLPIVLHDGTLLVGPGLHRPSGVVFIIADALMKILPDLADCTPEAVGEAMRFLCDEWLVDVACDYASKCIIVASALTIIERALLPERPAFFMTAGQRGGGKTTLINMISMAILGIAACAHAWSKDEDERRKALLSYFSAGLPMLTWDNIERGSTISCPHIERALTNEFYSDRVLGATQHRLVLTSTVHFFTGNNIAPRGDMASRSLTARLAVDRTDPEIGPSNIPTRSRWAEANRGRILAAMFTILMGNPRRRPGEHTPDETRFKTWWDIVGSAVENAAKEHARLKPGIIAPSFRDLFLER